MPLKELTQEDIDNLYSCSQRPGGGWMGAAMIIHRHYEKLENEDEKGRPVLLAASLWYLMMTKPRAVIWGRSRSPLKDVVKEKATK